MAAGVADAIDSVTDDEITAIVNQVPGEWGLLPDEAKTLRDYLIQRRPSVSRLVRQLEGKETAA
jgi:hypothetical protein